MSNFDNFTKMDRAALLSLTQALLCMHEGPRATELAENAEALVLAAATGIEITQTNGEAWLPVPGHDHHPEQRKIFAMACVGEIEDARERGALKFTANQYSDLITQAEESKAAYDACLIIAIARLRTGMPGDLAQWLAAHLEKPTRPRKGGRGNLFRDETIQKTIWELERGGIHPTGNDTAPEKSGCYLVQETLKAHFSYDAVKKIWAARNW